MEKFIRTNVDIQRHTSNVIKDENLGVVLKLGNETLTVTIEYVGSGNTSKIPNDQLMHKIIELLGDELILT